MVSVHDFCLDFYFRPATGQNVMEGVGREEATHFMVGNERGRIEEIAGSLQRPDFLQLSSTP